MEKKISHIGGLTHEIVEDEPEVAGVTRSGAVVRDKQIKKGNFKNGTSN